MKPLHERNTAMKSTRLARARLRTTLVTIALLGALLGAGLIVWATTSSNASTHGNAERGQVLRFGVQFSPFNLIDVPPLQRHDGDFKAGDYAVFSDVLTDHNGRRVGAEAGTGMITRVDKTGAQIYYTMAIKLQSGQITGSGLGTPAPRKHLAVTGGTGTFTVARGSIRLVENGDGTGTLKITLR